MNKWMRGTKGFTLLEVLVALVFLAVGLLALAGLHVTSLRGNSFSHHLSLATVAAQDRLEFLKNLPLSSKQLVGGKHDDQQFTPPGSGMSFARTYIVTEANGIKTIQCTVRWNDGRRDHSVSFTTCRAQ